MNSYKQAIAERFGRAAHTYDSVARLQQQTGERLLAQLNSQTGAKQQISIDLGTGTGYFLPNLALNSHKLIAADLSPGMLAFARAKQSSLQAEFVTADAEQLPLADNSVDQIFSNLVLQWTDLSRVLSEAKRILRAGGQIGFTTLLSDTLHELRGSWLQLDPTPHVNRFIEARALEQVLEHCSLSVTRYETVTHQLTYDSCFQLLRELKDLGAGFVPGRKSGLTTGGQLRQLEQIYRDQYQLSDQKLPASWHVAYVVLEKANA